MLRRQTVVPKPEVIKDEFCFVDGLLFQFLACVCE